MGIGHRDTWIGAIATEKEIVNETVDSAKMTDVVILIEETVAETGTYLI